MQTKQRLDVPLSLKSVSDSGEFEGYGSVFGVKDSHDDVVMSGAFAASLRAWSDRKALPALLWQHRMDEPIGVYTEMKEDDVGLYVRGRLLIDDDPLAKRAHAHMKAGSLTGLFYWVRPERLGIRPEQRSLSAERNRPLGSQPGDVPV
ncbi:pro-head protease [Escherichia coli]|nr:pro-head protease [Escherichia coli]